jgi:hypothetical protein
MSAAMAVAAIVRQACDIARCICTASAMTYSGDGHRCDARPCYRRSGFFGRVRGRHRRIPMYGRKPSTGDVPSSIKDEPEKRRCHDFRLDQLGTVEAGLIGNHRSIGGPAGTTPPSGRAANWTSSVTGVGERRLIGHEKPGRNSHRRLISAPRISLTRRTSCGAPWAD